MKVWTIAAVALALAACSPTAPTTEAPPETPVAVNAPSGEYALDPYHTNVLVQVTHFGLSHYTLRFNTASGVFNFNAEDPTQSTLEATVDIASLDTPFTGPRDFDAELQNSEWLDGASFPTASFRSTSIERTGPNSANVTGDLTIHGQTHPITLAVTYNASYAQHPMGMPVSLIGFSAQGEFSRSAYGVTTLLPSGPDATDGVSDTVQLLINAEFTRPVTTAAN